MKLIWIAVPALAVALTVSGCKNRKEEPIPPPHAGLLAPKTTLHLPSRAAAPTRLQGRDDRLTADHNGGGGMRHGASGISWFQGSFEEAFSISCSCHCYHFGLKP
jgi:hypothetical protein